jgi:hypothetical protein
VDRYKTSQGLVVALFLVAGLFVAAVPVAAHSGLSIDSSWSDSAPGIDGAIDSGEWADAAVVNLSEIPGNRLPAYLMIKNNGTFLWLAYDATGDSTDGVNDSASFALDTGHDGVGTDGAEDQFVLSGIFPGESAHLVYGNGTWVVEDAPFDTNLTDHAGLAGMRGFGPSDRDIADHRIYEFQIPLVLVETSLGDTLGLFGGSAPVPGVLDYSEGFAYSTWPEFVGGPIPLDGYGDLNLAAEPGPIGVVLTLSTASEMGSPGETVWYNLTARNTGTDVNDTFDITVLSGWPADLWTADGLSPLPDTDLDGTPDTGNLTSGNSTSFVVKVTIPGDATGCDVAMVVATSSWNLSVSDSSDLTTCIAAAAFDPPHSDEGVDTDADELFNFLRVSVSLIVSQAGSYFVTAALYDGTGSVFIDATGTNLSSPPGPVVVVLDLDGRTIAASGVDGPYFVGLTLQDTGFQVLDTDTHTTGPYNSTDFNGPPAAFRPPHHDEGVDTDVPPDGHFDLLSLNVSLFVEVAGTYDLSTFVTDSAGFFVTSGYSSFALSTGDQIANMLYPGDAFARADADGPYTIDLTLYSGPDFIDRDVHVTGPYSRTDFDPPPIAFNPPHSDRGVDTDVPADGYYNWLAVSANVTVGEAADYVIEARLYDSGGLFLISTATKTETLAVGPATVDVRFPGIDIRRAGVDGPYLVILFAYLQSRNGTGDFDVYRTQAYSASEFQPPSALFSGPHSDRGVDTTNPADGAFDWLEVSARISVSQAGRFTLQATLESLGREVFLTDAITADLPTGSVSLPLRFDGHLIRLAQYDGPFAVYFRLNDAEGMLLDDEFHLTAAYNASDFQAMDGSAPDSSASRTGGYWKNGPVSLRFTANDASPSDGLVSVRLYYRYSTNNATWGGWTLFDTQVAAAPGLRTMSGDFLFDLPAGEGYYELYTVAMDGAGRTESAPAAADVRVAAFVPAKIDLTPPTESLVAGTSGTFRARVLNAAGTAVVLESPLVVSLVSDSRGGEFLAQGTSTAITTLTIPAGASEASFDYRDTAAGTSTITTVSSHTDSDAATLTVSTAAVAGITISPAGGTLAVGSTLTLTSTARDAFGNPISDPELIWSIEGPGSLSGRTGTSVTLTVTGEGTIRVTAVSSSTSTNATVTWSATAGGLAARNLSVGLGGGAALGLLAGIVVGWVAFRRRKARGASPPPKEQSPGELI